MDGGAGTYLGMGLARRARAAATTIWSCENTGALDTTRETRIERRLSGVMGKEVWAGKGEAVFVA